MKIAINQPYLFPYIGYFQLLANVDTFVSLDDVQFIIRGWINRNNILLNGRAHLFTVPLSKVSRSDRINQVATALNPKWLADFEKTLSQAYSKAPFFSEIFELITSVMRTPHETIADLAETSIKIVCNYLDLRVRIVDTSAKYNNQALRGAERLIDICKQEQADNYFNLPGGRELYSKADFQTEGIDLRFLSSPIPRYPQHGAKQLEFVPNLSILDLLMNLPKEEARALLENANFE